MPQEEGYSGEVPSGRRLHPVPPDLEAQPPLHREEVLEALPEVPQHTRLRQSGKLPDREAGARFRRFVCKYFLFIRKLRAKEQSD